eukprot:TRINITY_DN270_c0_g1_i2.p1 TRINITY_DN270_c0_g1~~TRINITY_DN270_c0_g1_i2.p1  ORF type:complete len:103 (+),score=14.87 TRINITY_DN270_c0_g1_i2:107-415(+)
MGVLMSNRKKSPNTLPRKTPSPEVRFNMPSVKRDYEQKLSDNIRSFDERLGEYKLKESKQTREVERTRPALEDRLNNLEDKMERILAILQRNEQNTSQVMIS